MGQAGSLPYKPEIKFMDFALSDEHRMLKDLVARFVREELLPLERLVLERESNGAGTHLTTEETAPIDKKAKELGLWGLDAPEDVGGADLPEVAMVGVLEELGKTVTPYVFPPDSPNLRMLKATVNAEQRAQYLAPYAQGEKIEVPLPNGLSLTVVRMWKTVD